MSSQNLSVKKCCLKRIVLNRSRTISLKDMKYISLKDDKYVLIENKAFPLDIYFLEAT